jgi:hypothetical protein
VIRLEIGWVKGIEVLFRMETLPKWITKGRLSKGSDLECILGGSLQEGQVERSVGGMLGNLPNGA